MKSKFLLIKAKCQLRIFLFVLSALYANASFAVDVTWIGPAGTFASNPASWSPAGVPTPVDNVIIPDGAPPLIVDLTTTWASVRFVGGGATSSLGIGLGVSLTVTGAITIEDASAPRPILMGGPINCAAINGGTNTGGGNLIVLGGGIAILTVTGNVTNCNLTMIVNSRANFGGDFTGTVDFPFGIATIDFNSTDAQTIPAETYVNMIFSGGGTKTTTGPITATGNINFVDGIVINATPIFLDGSLGGVATVSGGSPTSFATGQFRFSRPAGATLNFPVGKQAAGYHPVAITTGAAGDFTVEYIRASGAALGPITAPGILAVSNCEYWNITRTSGGNADVTLTWNSTSSCGGTYITDPPSLRVVHFNGTSWNAAGSTGGTGTATAGSVTWTGVTAFTSFTIGTTSALNPLPVTLTDFSASRCGNNICLYWNTASQINNDHFEIERSADGRQFTSIGRVNGNATSSVAHNYTFPDDRPLNGRNYYRIRQVDINNRFSYSAVLRVNYANASSFSVSITPNPAASVMNLSIEGIKEKEKLVFEIMNSNGMIVHRENISAGGTTMVKNLPRPAVTAGLYFYKITRTSNNETFSGKLVLQ